ncbi:LexA family protein [Alicyclobacillus macrosporangiidus]|uniref:LexA family protein n=1 Tax=Alicyclobacillus macrosporangiidus TaxID=392015 RepID=UPI0004970058|nr:hypothetical protein [Alicyclobacillus macrosporangiidus]
MDMKYLIPVLGTVPSLSTMIVDQPENPSDLVIRSYAPYRRFAVQVADDGLDSLGLTPGDYAIFREQRWPHDECQVCLIAFGNEFTLRILQGIWNTEPILCVSGDKIPPITRHRNDFVILGVLDGVIKSELAVLQEPEQADFDWGC